MMQRGREYLAGACAGSAEWVGRGISKREIRELRARIATLVDEASTNERLLKRSQERELELLKAENLPQLFEAICQGLKTSYALEHVTLLLWDPQHEIRHLLIADQIACEEFPHVIFADSVVEHGAAVRSFHRPWLGPYMGCDHQLLFPGASKR